MYNQDRNHAWTGLTDVGNDSTPDVAETAPKLQNNQYLQFTDNSKLLPVFQSGQQTSFSDVFGEVVDVIEAGNKQTISISVDITRDLEQARTAMQGTIEGRQAEQAAGLIRDVNLELSYQGATWVRTILANYNFSPSRILPCQETFAHQFRYRKLRPKLYSRSWPRIGSGQR